MHGCMKFPIAPELTKAGRRGDVLNWRPLVCILRVEMVKWVLKQ